MLHIEEEEPRPVLRLGLEANREAAGGGIVGQRTWTNCSIDADQGGGIGGISEVLGHGVMGSGGMRDRSWLRVFQGLSLHSAEHRLDSHSVQNLALQDTPVSTAFEMQWAAKNLPGS